MVLQSDASARIWSEKTTSEVEHALTPGRPPIERLRVLPMPERGVLDTKTGRLCNSSPSSVVSLKFIEEQKQILRLTTPELKDVRGPVRSE